MSVVRLAVLSRRETVEIPKACKSSKIAGENNSGRESWAIERWKVKQ